MKKVLFIIFITIELLLISFFVRKMFFKNIAFKNFQINSLSQNIEYHKNLSQAKLLKGESVKFEFTAVADNLGTVEISINNYSRINTDKLDFKLKDKSSSSWVYQGLYETSMMDAGQPFPFGFPIIPNSKGRTYQIELKSLQGSEGNFVGINSSISKFFKAKYFYSKEYFKQNPVALLAFFLLKFNEIVGYFTTIQKITLMSALTTLTGLFLIIYDRLELIPKLNKKIKLRFDLGLIVTIAAYVFSHLKFLDYSQYWDSDWYLQLLISAVNSLRSIPANNLGLLIETFVTNFNFLGHTSMLYSGYLAIGQLLFPNNIYVLNIQNMLLGIVGIIGFRKIMEDLFPKKVWENTLFTLIFAFNPLFYATTISLNTDMPTLVFSLLVIYAFLQNNLVSILLSSAFLIFSKETGIIIYLSILLSYLLTLGIKKIKINFKNLPAVLTYLLPFLLFLLYYLFTKGNIHSYDSVSNTGNSYEFKWDNNGFFTFGINSKNLLIRSFQMFLMNFGWVGVLLLTISLIRSFFYKKSIFKFFSSEQRDKLLFMLCSYLPFITMTLLFLTMDFSRYVVPVVFFNVLILRISIEYLLDRSRYKYPLIVFIITLTVIQVYKPIDPSASLIFGKSFIGKNESSKLFGFRDGLVYNTQFYFIDPLSKKIEKEIEGYPVVIDASAEYYFKRIKHVSTVRDRNYLNESSLVYIYVPWLEDVNGGLGVLTKDYTVIKDITVDYQGYYVTIYFLRKNLPNK